MSQMRRMGKHGATWSAVVSLTLGFGLLIGLLIALSPTPSAASAATGPDAPRQAVGAVVTAGDVITVCLSGACDFDEIQAAVDAAQDGGEIRVAAGIYTGVSTRAGVTQMVYISKSVSLRGGYATTNWHTPHPISTPTTLDAQGQGRVLYIAAGVSPTIEGLGIRGGSAEGLGGGPSGQDVGGGAYVGAGSATISGCHVVGNTALWGGGLYVRKGGTALLGNRIEGNAALPHDLTESRGGGVYLREDESVLLGNAVHNNRADWGGGLYLFASRAVIEAGRVTSNTVKFYGGGLCSNFGAPTVRSNVFARNTAESGGGLWVWEANPLTLTDNVLVDNVADWGGGLNEVDSEAFISGNLVTGNRAGRGGGILLDNGHASLVGNHVVRNETTQMGGGLYLYRTDAWLTNTLVAENVAGEGGSGLSVIGGEARLVHTTMAGDNGVGLSVHGGAVTLTNTILVGYELGLSVDAAGLARLHGTLWGTGEWANGADWSGTGGIIHANDYWGDPAFVDDDLSDYHLSPTSVAIDRGGDAGVDRDIDGDPRPVPVGGGFDLGVDEYAEIDLSRSLKTVHPDEAEVGDVVTYTLRLLNEGNLESRDTRLVDPVPAGTTYISGSAATSGGVLSDGDTIRWQGTLTPQQPVTITFSVTLEQSSVVRNTAVVTDERGGVTTLLALVNGQRLYLPLIAR